MRVEQRIGRIDRIGQRYDEVIILNYSYENTVESDIYDRLDDRIGLFEYVVGNMQPILSSVGSKIRQAAMQEGAKAGSKEYERLEQDIENDIEEQQNEKDPVELRDSLANLDDETPLREQVIEEARLGAWESFSHPDLGDVGIPEGTRDPVYTIEAAKAVFLDNDVFSDSGISLELLSEFDDEFSLSDAEHAESVYCLHGPDDKWGVPVADEGTLGGSIAQQLDGVGVTFSPEIADEYPSLQYLAPGNPLFAQLSKSLINNTDEQNLDQHCYGYDTSSSIEERSTPPWIGCGWSAESSDEGSPSLVSLNKDGEVSGSRTDLDSLERWVRKFVANRNRANS